MSEANRQALYNAIHSEIMSLRVEIKMHPDSCTPNEMDYRLYGIVDRIWACQAKVLRIT